MSVSFNLASAGITQTQANEITHYHTELDIIIFIVQKKKKRSEIKKERPCFIKITGACIKSKITIQEHSHQLTNAINFTFVDCRQNKKGAY